MEREDLVKSVGDAFRQLTFVKNSLDAVQRHGPDLAPDAVVSDGFYDGLASILEGIQSTLGCVYEHLEDAKYEVATGKKAEA